MDILDLPIAKTQRPSPLVNLETSSTKVMQRSQQIILQQIFKLPGIIEEAVF